MDAVRKPRITCSIQNFYCTLFFFFFFFATPQGIWDLSFLCGGVCESVCVCVCVCVCVRARACALSVVSNSFATPWTAALEVPLSMGLSWQEYWSGLPWPPPGDLPSPGIELASPAAPTLQADSLPLNHWGSPLSWLFCDFCLFI